jgi:hypothetical protein
VSPHEQWGSEGRSAGIEGIATRMGWTMVKYHSSIFSIQILLQPTAFRMQGRKGQGEMSHSNIRYCSGVQSSSRWPVRERFKGLHCFQLVFAISGRGVKEPFIKFCRAHEKRLRLCVLFHRVGLAHPNEEESTMAFLDL